MQYAVGATRGMTCCENDALGLDVLHTALQPGLHRAGDRGVKPPAPVNPPGQRHPHVLPPHPSQGRVGILRGRIAHASRVVPRGGRVRQARAAAPGDSPGAIITPGGDPSLLAGIPTLARVAAWGGGFPIKVNGEVVGAIGLSGAPTVQNDEDCARAALALVPDAVMVD